MSSALRFLSALTAVLVISTLAFAQDLSGTWLKATATARLSALNNGTSLEDAGEEPDLTAKVKPVRRAEPVYIFIDEASGIGVYPIEIFTVGPTGLISSCAFGTLSVGDGGVIAGMVGDLTMTEKTKDGVSAAAFITYQMRGGVKVKVDKEVAVKRVTLVADGIALNAGLLAPESLEDGSFQPAAGTLRIRGKSVPESKVPLIDEAPGLIKGLAK